MKKIGFLSFGHWTPSPQSGTRSAADALLQSIDLAVAAEELGADGAYFRVHHFARQLGFALSAARRRRRQDQARSSSAPPSSTCAMRTRSTWPRMRARPTSSPAAACSSASSRGSPEQVIDGWRYFGYAPPRARPTPTWRASHAEVFLEVLKGEGFAQPNPRPMFPNPPGHAAPRAAFGGPARPHLVGRRHRRHGRVGGEAGHEPAELDAEIRRGRRAVPHPAGQPDPRTTAPPGRKPATRTSRASRSAARIFALVNDTDRAYFGGGDSADHFGYIEPEKRAVFGRSYAAEPDVLVEQLKRRRGDRRGRHAAADRAQPARRRLQRPRHRERS